MTDDEQPSGPGTGIMVASAVLSFLLITPIAVYLLDLNWTQAVLVGGFAALISAFSAVISGRRMTETDTDDA
ncbi:hypothetical protein JCM17823_25040 [Halorubrum gandharaense]